MDQHKPLHLITSLPEELLYQICTRYGLSIEDSTTHKRNTSQQHTHAYITWPLGRTKKEATVIQPQRAVLVKFIRRNYGCNTCHDTSSGQQCPNCTLFLKFIWPHDQTHVDNIKRYIANPATEAVPLSKELNFRGHYCERGAEEEIQSQGSDEGMCRE